MTFLDVRLLGLIGWDLHSRFHVHVASSAQQRLFILGSLSLTAQYSEAVPSWESNSSAVHSSTLQCFCISQWRYAYFLDQDDRVLPFLQNNFCTESVLFPSSGRSYLSRNVSLLRSLMLSLQMEEADELARENALGCMQKLSLRYASGCSRNYHFASC